MDPRRKTPLRAASAVLLIAGSAWVAGCSAPQGHIASDSQAPPTQPTSLSVVTPAMMVGRESFPADAIGNWKAPYVYDEPSGGGSDQGCAPLLDRWERVGNSHILASLNASAEPRELRYRVDLIAPKNQDHPDISTVVEACPTLELDGHRVQIRRESVTGIPSWATAYTMNISDSDGPASTSVIAGNYRGIDIDVAASRNNSSSVAADMAVLATLFNDQVAKLESQP